MPICNQLSFCINYNQQLTKDEIKILFNKLKDCLCNEDNFKNMSLYTDKNKKTYFKINLFNTIEDNDVFTLWVKKIRSAIDEESRLKIYYNYGLYDVKAGIKSPNIFVSQSATKTYNLVFIDDDE